MKDFKKTVALATAKTSGFEKKVRSAQLAIKNALARKEKPYIAFSGGKDSTVVYDIVKQYKDDILLVWSDDEWWLPETEEYINRVGGVHQIRTNAYHTAWFQTIGDWDSITDYAKNCGCGLTFMGLRSEESTARRFNYTKRGKLYYAETDGMWHCCPIQDWTWKDVWAYIYSNKVDYNKAYDIYDNLGVSPEYQRIGPFAVESVLEYGQLSVLKQGWPSTFNKFAEKYPEVYRYL